MKNIIIALLMIPVFGFSQQKDTVKVIMLVCDTSHWNWVDSGIVNNKFVELARSGNRYNYSVQWQFGYEVRLKHIDFGMSGSVEYFTHIEYLGENKKTLSKNIVVWQSKNR